MNSINTSKRDEINEFLIKRSLKNSPINNAFNIKNHYVNITKVKNRNDIVHYRFQYICELELYNVDEIIYVYSDYLKRYLNIFSSNIYIDNIIDQNLQIDFSTRGMNIDLSDKAKFYTNVYPHRYSDEKKEKVFGTLNYQDNLHKLTDTGNHKSKLIDFKDFISGDITEIIENKRDCESIRNKRESVLHDNIIKHLIDFDNISAQITHTTVKNNGDIILHIEADNIIHEKDLEYTFENPMDKKSKFLRFIDYLDITSLDELELQPITLSQEPDKVSLNVNGFYINKTINNKQDNMQKSKSIVNQLISIIT